MEKISWTENIILSQEGGGDILRTIKGRKANWIGHICVGTAFKNTLLQEIYREEVTGRRGRRRKQLLHNATVKSVL